MTANGNGRVSNFWRYLRTIYAPANAVALPTWLITLFRTVATSAFSGRALIGSQWQARLVTTAANNRLNVAPTLGMHNGPKISYYSS
jgi:hypothetical protein